MAPTDPTRRALLRAAVAVPLSVPVAAGLAGTATAAPEAGGAAAAFAWRRTLGRGMTGADVLELQVRIAGWAADRPRRTYLSVDGDFGPLTEAALERFQRGYGLPVTGRAGSRTQDKLDALQSSDGSTRHFDFSEFWSKDGAQFGGGRVSATTVAANVRRLMWKLEALRRKAGGHPVLVNSGYRSIAHNKAIGGASNSQHTYGIAADVRVGSLSTRTVYRYAETTGFSGLEAYWHSWQHCDSRVQYPYGAQSWWWESGTVDREQRREARFTDAERRAQERTGEVPCVG